MKPFIFTYFCLRNTRFHKFVLYRTKNKYLMYDPKMRVRTEMVKSESGNHQMADGHQVRSMIDTIQLRGDRRGTGRAGGAPARARNQSNFACLELARIDRPGRRDKRISKKDLDMRAVSCTSSVLSLQNPA